MVNSVIPAANPAIGYSQWVTSIMHAPETLGLPLGTAKVKTWTLHGGFETLRLHDGPNSKLLTASRLARSSQRRAVGRCRRPSCQERERRRETEACPDSCALSSLCA
ncbi:hypothetical protein IG631_07397 [Alternaria alternata]|nr:hypothetical protein IG631_07397 [Alternaria alternata]